MRCNLADGRLVKENEPFETSPAEAAILIRGGIAKEAQQNGTVQTETPKEVKQEVPAKIADETIVLPPEQPQGDPPAQKEDKRRKKA